MSYVGPQCTLRRRSPSNHSGTAFSGFGDDEDGFYKTYSRAFMEVWDAEKEWADLASDSGGAGAAGENAWGRGNPPDMGGSQDPFETADAFYSRWSGFVSGLSFGWVDDYNLNEVSDWSPCFEAVLRVSLIG